MIPNEILQKTQDFRAAILETVSRADFAKIVQTLVTKAIDGNLTAARLILKYVADDRPEAKAKSVAMVTAKLAPAASETPAEAAPPASSPKEGLPKGESERERSAKLRRRKAWLPKGQERPAKESWEREWPALMGDAGAIAIVPSR